MGEVTEEGEASFLHPHSTLVGFLSPTARQFRFLLWKDWISAVTWIPALLVLQLILGDLKPLPTHEQSQHSCAVACPAQQTQTLTQHCTQQIPAQTVGSWAMSLAEKNVQWWVSAACSSEVTHLLAVCITYKFNGKRARLHFLGAPFSCMKSFCSTEVSKGHHGQSQTTVPPACAPLLAQPWLHCGLCLNKAPSGQLCLLENPSKNNVSKPQRGAWGHGGFVHCSCRSAQGSSYLPPLSGPWAAAALSSGDSLEQLQISFVTSTLKVRLVLFMLIL